MTGLGIDEPLLRTDAAGARSVLTDALGSVVALTDAAGIVQTQYTYEPFGNTTFSGAASTNAFQYTGRENDGTGLYYYRARYYHPGLQRFLSQDPAGLAGRDATLYGYVLNSPMNLIDPLGLYGTDDCSYYDQRCRETGSRYFCQIAPWVCRNFPNLPGNTEECIRKCLQDYDELVCRDPCDPSKTDLICTEIDVHKICVARCAGAPNSDPFL